MTLPALALGLGTQIHDPSLCGPAPLAVHQNPPNPDRHTYTHAQRMHICMHGYLLKIHIPKLSDLLHPGLPAIFNKPTRRDSEPPAGVSRSWSQFCAICVGLSKSLLLSGPQFLLCIRRRFGVSSKGPEDSELLCSSESSLKDLGPGLPP